VLRDLVVMLADGGDNLSAIETLRGQEDLDGAVASDSTAWRRVADLAGHELSVARLDAARRRVRATVWRHAPPAVDAGLGLLCVDLDATHVRSYPTTIQRRNHTGKTSSVQCVLTGPATLLPVRQCPGDREWLRCWLRRAP
jgi:hypothetical protein